MVFIKVVYHISFMSVCLVWNEDDTGLIFLPEYVVLKVIIYSLILL
jgi:hypothetical protein